MNVIKDNYYDELTLEKIVELDEKVKEYIVEENIITISALQHEGID